MVNTFSFAAPLMAVFLLASKIASEDVLTDRMLDGLFPNISHCFEMLGCITTSKEWLSINRPINLCPSSRDSIGTTFRLYTRSNSLQGETIRVAGNGDVPSQFYQPSKDTKIIVHGFLSNVTNGWVVDFTSLLLQGWDLNVITTDWSDGALATYGKAVANTRVVGLEIANLVNALIAAKGSTPSQFHCIGHSLGAHTCGYAGERIEQLDRITGLDPAGPLFCNTPPFVRLDQSDARFVDVIHTDAEDLGYGSQDISGTIDFYPHGGRRQPGAKVPGIPHSVIPQEIAEAVDLGSSHGRVVELYMDSMRASPTFGGGPRNGTQNGHSACPFVGFRCDSYESFIDGNCASCGEDGSNCAVMGIDANAFPVRRESYRGPNKFFLNTNSKSPFNACHYTLKLTLPEHSAGRSEVEGSLTATVIGDLGVASDMKLTQSGTRKIKKGMTYTFLGSSPVNTGHITRANVAWKWKPHFFSKENCLFNCVKNIFVSHAEITNMGFYPRFDKSTKCDDQILSEFKDDQSTPLDLTC